MSQSYEAWEIEHLANKINAWTHQANAAWTTPAERVMYLAWIADAQRKIDAYNAKGQ